MPRVGVWAGCLALIMGYVFLIIVGSGYRLTPILCFSYQKA